MSEISIAPIPFYNSEDRTSDELGGAMPLSVNVIADSTGGLHARPGISVWPSFPADAPVGSAVIGMTSWRSQLVWVTADRKIHALPATGAVVELSSDADPNTLLDGGLKPSFVAGREMLVIAGGGAMQKWTGAGLSARLENVGLPGVSTDPGGPPPPTNQICGVAQRLIAAVTGDSGQLWWSGPLEEYENWDMAVGGASFIQAAAKPDPLTALADNTNEVFAFGSLTLQVFAPANLAVDGNDPNNVLDFAPSRTMNLGITARDSIVPIDDTFALFDRLRRIVITDGRSYTDASAPIAQLLREFPFVDDCWAFRMRFGRWDCIVFFFPTVKRGIIWNTRTSTWTEWVYSEDGVESDTIPITSAYHWAEQDVFLVGLVDGRIALLDDTATTDLGVPIPIKLKSGFVTQGVSVQKACKTVLLAFRKTPSATSGSGKVRLSRRDSLGAFKLVKEFSLSDSLIASLQIRSVGVYRQRQWLVEYSGSDGFVFVSMHEEFEPLGA